jgi:hypothetical protein
MTISPRGVNERIFTVNAKRAESRTRGEPDEAMLRTVFRDLQPDVVFSKAVLVGIEPLQSGPSGVFSVLIHRRILLMAEDDAFAGATLPRRFAALGALWLLLVAFQLPGPARQTTSTRTKSERR